VALSAAIRQAGRDKLERFLSKAGVLSRREAGRRIRAGDVTVNGVVIMNPLQLMDLRDDVQLKDYGRVTLVDWSTRRPRVVLFNKPLGVVTSLRGSQHHGSSDLHLQALQDVLPEPFRGGLTAVPALRPVGRLDAQSVGLLLLTDSSELGNRLTGPGSCGKEYLLRVTPLPDEMQLARLREGVRIADGKGKTTACTVSLVQSESSRGVLRFVIHEGRNRQLRRMCRAVGLDVEWLMRTRIGALSLGSLPLGDAREATVKELDLLDA